MRSCESAKVNWKGKLGSRLYFSGVEAHHARADPREKRNGVNRVNMNRVDTDKSELNRRRLLLSAGLAGAALAVGCTPDAGKSAGKTSPVTTTKPTASPTTATPSPPSAKESLPAPDYHLPPIENGMAPVITKITTEQPVVFLTIDDGVTKNPELITLLQKYKYPVYSLSHEKCDPRQPTVFREVPGIR